jgi:hypothetical protein
MGETAAVMCPNLPLHPNSRTPLTLRWPTSRHLTHRQCVASELGCTGVPAARTAAGRPRDVCALKHEQPSSAFKVGWWVARRLTRNPGGIVPETRVVDQVVTACRPMRSARRWSEQSALMCPVRGHPEQPFGRERPFDSEVADIGPRRRGASFQGQCKVDVGDGLGSCPACPLRGCRRAPSCLWSRGGELSGSCCQGGLSGRPRSVCQHAERSEGAGSCRRVITARRRARSQTWCVRAARPRHGEGLVFVTGVVR